MKEQIILRCPCTFIMENIREGSHSEESPHSLSHCSVLDQNNVGASLETCINSIHLKNVLL